MIPTICGSRCTAPSRSSGWTGCVARSLLGDRCSGFVVLCFSHKKVSESPVKAIQERVFFFLAQKPHKASCFENARLLCVHLLGNICSLYVPQRTSNAFRTPAPHSPNCCALCGRTTLTPPRAVGDHTPALPLTRYMCRPLSRFFCFSHSEHSTRRVRGFPSSGGCPRYRCFVALVARGRTATQDQLGGKKGGTWLLWRSSNPTNYSSSTPPGFRHLYAGTVTTV